MKYSDIKFRIFNTYTNKMIYCQGLKHAVDDFGGILGLGKGWESVVSGEYPIMQFTGIKDIEGNDIYEGDILFSDWHDSEWVVKNGEYNNYNDDYLSGFYLENISIQNRMSIGYKMCLTTYSITYNNNDFKVSGNIYEKE